MVTSAIEKLRNIAALSLAFFPLLVVILLFIIPVADQIEASPYIIYNATVTLPLRNGTTYPNCVINATTKYPINTPCITSNLSSYFTSAALSHVFWIFGLFLIAFILLILSYYRDARKNSILWYLYSSISSSLAAFIYTFITIDSYIRDLPPIPSLSLNSVVTLIMSIGFSIIIILYLVRFDYIFKQLSKKTKRRNKFPKPKTS